MNQEGTMALFQYWNDLRGTRPAPRRTEIEPGDIRRYLADTFILEMDVRSEPVFRLAGTRMCATYGRELKGHAFTPLWSNRDQPMMSRLAGNVFRDNSVVVITYMGTSHGGRSNPFEMLLLPLEGGQSNQRLLGCALPVKKPFWLGADAIYENQLETLRIIDPDREPLFLKNRPSITVPPPTDTVYPPSPVNPARRHVRHLVVIEGGKTDQ
ncbi:MAG: PAS domain-containing protein [Rhizobiaceae bacterium]